MIFACLGEERVRWNSSVSRWRTKTLKGERNLLKKKVVRLRRHKAVERRLGSGGVVATGG